VPWCGGAQPLAVDSDRPSPPAGTVPLGQPGTDRVGQPLGVQPAERTADGGLGPDGEAARGIAAGAERSPDHLSDVELRTAVYLAGRLLAAAYGRSLHEPDPV
jgi:hypothetical protein